MTTNKAIGFALGLLGVLIMWQTAIAIAQVAHIEGLNRLASLMVDPENSLRLLAAMAAFIAGLAALTERQGGAWLAGFAAALLGVQTLAYMGGHGHLHSWQHQAVLLLMMTGLFLAVVVSSANSPAEAAEPAIA